MSEENKQLSGVMLELYKDSLQPSVRIWGKYLGDLASRRVRALRKNLLKAADKLQQENPENIISPKFDVAMPILEKMRITEEETLADAYAELLKNSCLKDQQAKVLPAYSQILSSITPDEVKILDFVYREKNTYKTPVREVIKFANEKTKRILVNMNVSDDTLIPYPIAGIPFLEVRSNLKEREGGKTLAKYFTDIDSKVDLSSSESVEVYIDNLQSLGILDAQDSSFLPIAIYSDLESEAARQYKAIIERENHEMALLKGSIYLTPLAQSFLAMCTSKRDNRESNAPPA
ncbi:MAG: Abi-alpha family protein [Rhodobacteraceae bacterium]|nr:Abi-alpha family protein [Paracoccaceae bacterium]